MKKIIFISAIFGVLLGAIPASAADYNYGALFVDSFIQAKLGGNWTNTQILKNGGRYRFRLDVGNTTKPVSDAERKRYGRPFYNQLYFRISGSKFRFYKDDSFSGSYRTVYSGRPKPNTKIYPARASVFYVYAIWAGPNNIPVVPLPPNLQPMLEVQATWGRSMSQARGPKKPIQPNM